jgi:hypothetical protein
MKLLVSGCSFTHGAELYNGFMHPENIKLSYSKHIADKLKINLLNVALSAGSNEYIFHSLIEELYKNDDIHSVIVMWTSTGRLCWKADNRHYFFHGNFASSMVDLVNFKMHDLTIDNCWFTGDSHDIVKRIAAVHKFFVTDYFDNNQESIKLENYKKILYDICLQKNIKLISIDLLIFNLINKSIFIEGRHPNASEHKELADMIYNTYYAAHL